MITPAANANSAHAFCPICGDRAEGVFRTDRLPAEAHRLCHTREAARAVRRGPIDLRRCTSCDHGFNAAFDPALVTYDSAYHNPLHHSLAFQHFARQAAERIAALTDVTGSAAGPAVEIGCGDGWFTHHLAKATARDAIGTDPAITGASQSAAAPNASSPTARVTLAPASTTSAALATASVMVARHVLEHIAQPTQWLADHAQHLPEGAGVYLETPAAESIWAPPHQHAAQPWDLLYEHAHSFSVPSLAAIAWNAGLRVHDAGIAYAGQFAWVTAHRITAPKHAGTGFVAPTPPARTVEFDTALASVRAALASARRPVVWGAGTKAITMLNLVADAAESVAGVVDINPAKRGAFIPGVGTEIIGPAEIASIRPDLVVLANGMYRDEVAAELGRLGCGAPIHTLVPGPDTLTA